MKYTFRTKIRTFLIAIWILTLAFFIIKLIVPNGVITYSSDFSKRTGFIFNLTPQERINDLGDKVKITADPVYFSLHYPRQFQEAQIKLRYKWENVDKQVLEMGVLADKDLWQYHLEPLENTILEEVMDNWHVSKSDNLLFLQKTKDYESLDEFLQSDFPRNSTAIYNINTQDLNISDFSLNESKTIGEYIIEQDLIGHHQFYIYHSGGDFRVEAVLQDINQNDKEDKIDMILFYQDKFITKESLDSIISLESREVSELKDLIIELNDLSEGLYKVQIKASDDVIIKEIRSSSDNLVFINNIYLGYINNDLKLYTDSNHLKVTTVNSASLQTLSFAGASFDLDATYKQHYFQSDVNNKDSWQEINLKKGGLKLSSTGMFSFNDKSAFNPEMISLDDSVSLENINYIIANYEPVEKDSDWHIARAKFDLSRAYTEDNKYSFMFSLPNFSYKQDSALIIDSIEISLKGKSIWQKIKEIIE